MYLSQAQLRSTLSTLTWAFPRHTLIVDLMTKRFCTRYGGPIRQRLAMLGTDFTSDLPEDPTRLFAAQGYRSLSRVSMMTRASELGVLPVPKFLLDTLLTTLRDGYCVYGFEAGSHARA